MSIFSALRHRLLPFACLVVLPVASQVDQAWLRMWLDVQAHRPAHLAAVGRIAPATEPGTPLDVDGRVFNPDGTTPAPDVIVFAYQTDRRGLYFSESSPGAPWRLHGWVKTGPDGRFVLRTIRPGPYPNRSEPAHIHFTVQSPVFGRQWTPSLRFADDPLVSADLQQQSDAARPFGFVCAVRMADGVQQVTFLVKLKRTPDF